MEYLLQAAIGGFESKNAEGFIAMFNEFSSDPLRPIIWLTVFMLLTHIVIVKGVKNGIERSSKVLMPVLFILVVLLAICSVTLPGAEKGLEFLFKPDFSKVTPEVFLGAMGQAFFSMSLGMGCLSTYASYFGKETRLGHTAMSVGIIDTFVAILAGIIIFPAAFSVGINPGSGAFADIHNLAECIPAGLFRSTVPCYSMCHVFLSASCVGSTDINHFAS